jgi:hypothetical protein
MEIQTDRRLANIRAQWMTWSALTDTATWDTTFLLQIIDSQNREIEALRAMTVTGKS